MNENEYLIIDDTKYDTILTEKFKNRKNFEPKNPNLLKAFIPGTIVKVFVNPGDEVKKGDNLLILEAMKMKNTIASPRDAKIKVINVKRNFRVKKDQVLLEFE